MCISAERQKKISKATHEYFYKGNKSTNVTALKFKYNLIKGEKESHIGKNM